MSVTMRAVCVAAVFACLGFAAWKKSGNVADMTITEQ